MTWRIREITFLEKEKVTIPSKNTRGKGQSVVDLWKGTLEELDAATNIFIRFLGLRIKSEYA